MKLCVMRKRAQYETMKPDETAHSEQNTSIEDRDSQTWADGVLNRFLFFALVLRLRSLLGGTHFPAEAFRQC